MVVHESCQPDFVVSPPLGKSNLLGGPFDSNEEVITFYKSRPKFSPYGARLPGQGDPGQNCGVPEAHHCNHCGKAFWAYSACRQRDCPACYEKWASKEAFRASKRIWQYHIQLMSQDVYHRIIHCVFSFRFTGQTLTQLRKRVRQLARKHGLSGELVIFHPFRQKDDSWMMDGTVHFHLVAIAFGDVLAGSSEFYNDGDNGYFFKHIPDRVYHDYRGIRKFTHLRRLVLYQLSHAGVVNDRHAVTWSGSISYRNFKTLEPDEPGIHGVKCPICGSDDTEPAFQHIRFYNDFTGRMEHRYDMVHPEPIGAKPPNLVYRIVWGAS